MIDPDTVPEATAPPEHHADFLELCAVRSLNRSASLQELVRDFEMANVGESIADSEGLDEPGEPHEQSEALAEAAFAELDERRRSCGANSNSYPFIVSNNLLQLREDAEKSLYTFLALLSWFGKSAGPSGTDGEKLFEEISAQAAEAYLGGPGKRARSHVFGFPRRVRPRGFAAALDKLCQELGEGQGHRKGRPKLPDQKDGKLDVVAWIEFEDRRQGKLILFGQCATGRNWEVKATELPPPERWCSHWMIDSPTVVPVRSFFVPHRVECLDWSHTCTFGGILYDRCRIASLASEAPSELHKRWEVWSAHVVKQIRRANP